MRRTLCLTWNFNEYPNISMGNNLPIFGRVCATLCVHNIILYEYDVFYETCLKQPPYCAACAKINVVGPLSS